VLLVFGLVLAAAQARAQYVYTVEVLKDPAARKELKTSPEVARKLDAIAEAHDTAEKDAVVAAADRDVPLDREALTSYLEEQSSRRAAKVLTPAQGRRAQEIFINMYGAHVLTHPLMVARLNLDPDQVAAIKAVYAGLPPLDLDSFPGTREEKRKARHEAQLKRFELADRQVLRLLTRRQRAEFEAMKEQPKPPAMKEQPKPPAPARTP
jgi:hypothetical protein